MKINYQQNQSIFYIYNMIKKISMIFTLFPLCYQRKQEIYWIGQGYQICYQATHILFCQILTFRLLFFFFFLPPPTQNDAWCEPRTHSFCQKTLNLNTELYSMNIVRYNQVLILSFLIIYSLASSKSFYFIARLG